MYKLYKYSNRKYLIPDKQKILKHHPDKRKALGEEVRRDDDYFTCITRAWEMLGNPVKRRNYDSVDPRFNDDIPEEKDAKNNFYEVRTRTQLRANLSICNRFSRL